MFWVTNKCELKVMYCCRASILMCKIHNYKWRGDIYVQNQRYWFMPNDVNSFQMVKTHKQWGKTMCWIWHALHIMSSYLLQTELPLDCPPLSPLVLSKWKLAGRCLCSSCSSCWWTWRWSIWPGVAANTESQSPDHNKDVSFATWEWCTI